VEFRRFTLIAPLMVESGGASLYDRLENGRETPPRATLPTAADLNMMGQKYFKQQGSGNPQSWDQGFENGYAHGFNRTHRGQ
jgi:hypothetical protein